MLGKAKIFIAATILSLVSFGWIIGDIFLSDYGIYIYLGTVGIIILLTILTKKNSQKI